jgi:glycosyltransferase involved in cell wall biosynthesis
LGSGLTKWWHMPRELKLGILASHPIQYQAPLFRVLARQCDLMVYYAQRQTPQAQAAAGFGVNFEWDIDLLSGYSHTFLENVAAKPDTGSFAGCDTPNIANEIDRDRFDAFLVMGWHLKCFWQAVRACRRHGVPVMVRGDSQLGTPRSWIKRTVKSALYPWIVRQFDACLYVGQRNREYLLHYGANENRLFFSPHCVDTEAFSAAAAATDRRAMRLGWGLREGDQAILFAGKLVSRKRPQDLITAAAHLRRRGVQVVLVWAGDGPERLALEAQGLTEDVPMVFLGFCNQSELPAVYRGADVLALPSDATETWGLVVNEALACGTPCVVSDACGCAPDMVKRGISGAAFPVGDVKGLADALAQVLAEPPSSSEIAAAAQAYSTEAAAAGVLQAAGRLNARMRVAAP